MMSINAKKFLSGEIDIKYLSLPSQNIAKDIDVCLLFETNNIITEARRQIQSLQTKLDRCEEALEFYAEEKIYPDWDDSDEPVIYEILDDKGTIARKALSEVSE